MSPHLPIMHGDHEPRAQGEATVMMHTHPQGTNDVHLHDTTQAADVENPNLGLDNHWFVDAIYFGYVVTHVAVLGQSLTTRN